MASNTLSEPSVLEPGGLRAFFGRRSGHKGLNLQDILTYAYLILGTVIMFGPVLWLVMSSFKDESLLFEPNPTFLPYRQARVAVEEEVLVRHDPNLVRISVAEGQLTDFDIEATNGIMHITNRLLLPGDLRARVDALRYGGEEARASYPDGAEHVALTGETGNFYELALDDRELSIFAELLAQTDLDETFAEPGEYTAFIPNNNAFNSLVRDFDNETLAALVQPENEALLREVLLAHLVPGRLAYLDLYRLEGERLPTLAEGPALGVQVDHGKPLQLYDVTFNTLVINGAEVVAQDISASNGFIHSIDAVMVPPTLAEALRAVGGASTGAVNDPAPAISADPEGALPSVVAASADHRQLASLLAASNLLETLETGERLTLFAPTDAAFEQLAADYGADTLAALMQPQNQALLDDLLRQHVLGSQARAVNLFRSLGDPLPTLLDEAPLNAELIPGETRRLAQVGSPQGAAYTLVDPGNAEAGVQTVFVYSTPDGGTSITLEPIREVFFSLENYTGALERFDFGQYLYNTVFVTVVATFMTLLVNSMAAFGLSKYRYYGRDMIFLVMISTLMVPVSVILVPAFIVISRLDMTNSLWGLIIPGAATPTGVFLLRQYMLTIPDELLDAARIDGSSEWRIYWQIVLPLARPALAVLAIFSVMWRWNDFLWPLIVVSQNDKFTLQVALNAFKGGLDVQWHYILAMTVLTLLPITIVFAFLQRYITGGIATTGLKG
ncbi:MAG: ABC transporter permease subunit [Anaerolineae bacterium]|nr:ABC transporter permease subunit [Anaerolineae bacterium]